MTESFQSTRTTNQAVLPDLLEYHSHRAEIAAAYQSVWILIAIGVFGVVLTIVGYVIPTTRIAR